MTMYQIALTVKSDATFSSGDGVAGALDREVEHDRHGLPYLRGRTLKGLLREEADNVLDTLALAGAIRREDWEPAMRRLFGLSSARQVSPSLVRYGNAQLPEEVRLVVEQTMRASDNSLSAQDVLQSLTAVRRQTAVGPDGVPVDGSLRAMRVVLRKTVLVAQVHSKEALNERDQALLAAAVLALRRLGTGRNRGRGRVECDLLDATGNSILEASYAVLAKEVAL